MNTSKMTVDDLRKFYVGVQNAKLDKQIESYTYQIDQLTKYGHLYPMSPDKVQRVIAGYKELIAKVEQRKCA